MKKVMMILVGMMGCVVCAAGNVRIYVSQDGDDQAIGSEKAPFKSLVRARDQVRKVKAEKIGASIEVILKDGVYELDKTFELSGKDNGTAQYPIMWRAEHRGKAILMGALKGMWRKPKAEELPANLCDKARGCVVVMDLPEEPPSFGGGGQRERGKKVLPLSVFEDGVRLTCARWPQKSFEKCSNRVPVETKFTTQGGIQREVGLKNQVLALMNVDKVRLEAWGKEKDLWAYGLWKFEWDDRRLPVVGVDAQHETFTVDGSSNHYGFSNNANYFVFNAACELDEPGEWYLDRANKKIFVWPKGNYLKGGLKVAWTQTLIRGMDLAHVTFDGLAFSHSQETAMILSQAQNVQLKALDIRHTGGWGIFVNGGKNVRVAGCDLQDLGEGGVWLNGGDAKTLERANHVVDNCRIGHYGRISPNYKPGVQLIGVGNTATHNLIYDSPHQGISFGGNDQYIAFNVIHDTCTFNDDAGSIYCCTRDWTQIGTVIEYNLIHFTGKKPRATNTEAIYLDDWSSGVMVRGNIINRATQGVYIGGGHNCTVTGNVICATATPISIGSRGAKSFAKATSRLGAKSGLYQKVKALEKDYETSAWRKYPHLLDVIRKSDPVKAHDPFGDIVTGNVAGGSGHYRDYLPAAADNTFTNNVSCEGNPGFIDFMGLNYNLKPGSVAWQELGGNTRFEEMGLYASAERLTPPVKYDAGVTKNPAEPRMEYTPSFVRADVVLCRKLETNETALASNFKRCEMPDWCKGVRITAPFGTADDMWRDYSFSFVPQYDGRAEVCLMGTYGEKTIYDDIRVTNGGQLMKHDWAAWHVRNSVERPPMGNIDPPYGVVEACEIGVQGVTGSRVGLSNHERQLIRVINVKKGALVQVAFKARCWNPINVPPLPAIDFKMQDFTRGVAPFRPNGNAFTAAMRVKVECAAKYDSRMRLLMSVGNGYNHGFRLELTPNMKEGTFAPVLEIGVGPKARAWKLAAEGDLVKPGVWVRLVATWDGAKARLYVDGREVAAGDYGGKYVDAGIFQVVTGASGESYGVRSIPFIVDGARVWTRALSPREVAAFAPNAPFERDTPDGARFLADVERGALKDLAEIEMWQKMRHSPLARNILGRAEALGRLAAKDWAGATRVRDAVLKAMCENSFEKGRRADFSGAFIQTAQVCGFANEVYSFVESEYAAAKTNKAESLPYVALRFAKTAERAGRADVAAKVRAEISTMDLRKFPHLAHELGMRAQFTANPQVGAKLNGNSAKALHFECASVADLVKVRAEIRALKKKGLPQGGVRVNVKGGIYRVKEPFELTAADSGEASRPIVWRAAAGEKVVFEGGFKVRDEFRVSTGDARLPKVAQKYVQIYDVRKAGFEAWSEFAQYGYYVDPAPAITELYQDGKRLTPARFPNAGWLKIKNGRLDVKDEKSLALEDLAQEVDLAATGFFTWTWADFSTAITNVDVQGGVLYPDLYVKRGIHSRNVRLENGNPYFLHNALCFLDAPGEWFLDRKSGLLYVWPLAESAEARQSECPNEGFVLAQHSQVMWQMKNVSNVCVEGFIFENGRYTGVTMMGCMNCVFAGNVIRRFGANGLEAHACGNCTIADNVLRTFGHGAAEVWGGIRKTLTPSGNLVVNNDFSDVENRRRTYAPCLHLDGVGTEVCYNHFHNAPSSAMRLEGNDFRIVSNLTENVLLESDDQGGVDIYCDASYFGNHYCFNTWKDIGRPNANNTCGQAGVRFDGNISGQTVYGNRFIRCGTGQFGGIQTCGGRLHVVDNNIFINCNMGMSITHYPIATWKGPSIRGLLTEFCLKRVCVTNEPFASRYPGIANLLETDQVNYLMRNITVGDTPLLVNPPLTTVIYGNLHFDAMPDLRKVSQETNWQPIPEESETGPRPTPRFVRACEIDGKCAKK